MRLPNGYGGVVNLGKKRRRPFAARITAGWTDEGKAIYKYIGYYAKKTEALQALAEYNNNPYDVDSRNLTFEEIYNMWSEKALKDVSRSKLICYKTAFANCPTIHNIKIKELKTPHMQKAIDSCKKRSQSTLNNVKILFNQVCRFALENDFISKDYSKFVTISNTGGKKAKREFSEEEIAVLWKNTDNFYVRFALILIYTGFRISELLQVKNKNVDLENGSIRGGLKTKAGINRLVPIHKRILPFIKELYNPENFYLYNNMGSTFNYGHMKINFVKTLEQLGISHTPHECRHTTATLLDKYGANPITIKKILGHSTQDLTSSVYIHKDLEELKRAINLIP